MSVSQRDQRIRVFTFADTSSDGRASSGYTYVGEFWGRVDAPTMSEATVAGQGEHRADAIVTLARDVPLMHDGLLKCVNDGRYYKVTGLPPVIRRSAERKAFAVYADDAPAFNITGEPT